MALPCPITSNRNPMVVIGSRIIWRRIRKRGSSCAFVKSKGWGLGIGFTRTVGAHRRAPSNPGLRLHDLRVQNPVHPSHPGKPDNRVTFKIIGVGAIANVIIHWAKDALRVWAMGAHRCAPTFNLTIIFSICVDQIRQRRMLQLIPLQNSL